MRDGSLNAHRRGAVLWAVAFVALGAVVIARNLLGLASAPPGMYVDEASIGYNAWAIAHFGVDEHGYHLPLYFQAFGEYKNPVYVYALAPFLRFLPLTPAVERLPAAIFGLLALLFITLAAWRLSRSLAIAFLVLLVGALTPWLVQQSRVGFEVVAMVATLCAFTWCLADERRLTPVRLGVAGCLLALSVLAYSAGRLEGALLAVAFVLCFRRTRRWWLALVPVVAVYAVVAVFAALHPGALTAEFSVVNIGSDAAGPLALLGRFGRNYISYFSPDFLFVHGDSNLRHNSGFTGMLLALSAPLLIAGIVVCVLRRRDALARFTIAGLLLAPVSGALTDPAPHALRGAVMLPFLFLLMTYGLIGLRDLLQRRPALVRAGAALAAAAVLVQGGLYMNDYFTSYPARAATAFDAGAVPAMTLAAHEARAHTVFVSSTIDEEPYIDVLAALSPPPPRAPLDGQPLALLRSLGFVVTDPVSAESDAAAGDIIVLAAGDPRPVRAQLVATQPAGLPPFVLVYRAEG